ncbi:MAG: hypothetical protein ACREUY_10645 [Burkholderiales bacterium]
MNSESRISLQAFISNTAITARVKRVSSNPNMDNMGAGARHWIMTLKAGRFSMRVPFSQGSAHTVAPTVADVLNCLASDAAGFDNARDFADWCGEYGYDADSRKVERIYKTVAKQAGKLRAMLGNDNYATLLFNTERM